MSAAERVEALKRALAIYEALPRLAEEVVQRMDKRGEEVSAEDIFGEEMEICRQMAELLPGRISRLHYGGRDGVLRPAAVRFRISE